MSEWSSGDVIANGIRLHYYRTGGDKLPVVLAHGFSDNGLCWTPVARVLQADYDVIMIDARNHGKSEAPSTPGGSRAQGDDLAGLIVALGLKGPMAMGHSMGGGAVLNYGTASLDHSTVYDNTGDVGGGIANDGTFQIFNTIIAGNHAGSGPDCYTTLGRPLTSNDYNLIQSTAGYTIAVDALNASGAVIASAEGAAGARECPAPVAHVVATAP